jgi:hypothetical protein
MPPLAKNWTPLFAFLCLFLVALDLAGRHVSSTVIALLALATAPWSLPWFAQLVQSLKVGSMELNFREHIEKLDEGQKAVAAALSAGIGSPGSASSGISPISGLSHAIPAAPDRGDSGGEDAGASFVSDPDDPNKNQFGGKPVASGRKLAAQVKPFPGSTELFVIRASVTSIDPTRPLFDDTPVIFYLHDSFAQKENRKLAKNGAATIECVSRGAFTMGAVVEEVQEIPLELDLAKDVPDAPMAFVSR